MVIIGAKGFAKETLEVLSQTGPVDNIYFFDNISDNLPERLFGRFPIIRSFEALSAHFAALGPEFVLGIGGTSLRETLAKRCTEAGGRIQTLLSPYARIGRFGVQIGVGSTVMTGAVVTADVSVGEGALINLNVSIGHDCRIGRYCEFSPGAHISGRCTIGDYCSFGTGCVVLPDVLIGERAVIGAGAVVVRDVPAGVTVAGIPAIPLHQP